jgi:hypothetical protein
MAVVAVDHRRRCGCHRRTGELLRAIIEAALSAASERITTLRADMAATRADLREVETQFCGSDIVRNLMHANDLRLLSILWHKNFPDAIFPTDNAYLPTHLQSQQRKWRRARKLCIRMLRLFELLRGETKRTRHCVTVVRHSESAFDYFWATRVIAAPMIDMAFSCLCRQQNLDQLGL